MCDHTDHNKQTNTVNHNELMERTPTILNFKKIA